MKHEYHKKIMNLEQEIKNLEREKTEAIKKGHGRGGAIGADQKAKIEDNYKKKLKDLETKLKEFKQKEKE